MYWIQLWDLFRHQRNYSSSKYDVILYCFRYIFFNCNVMFGVGDVWHPFILFLHIVEERELNNNIGKYL